MVWTRAGGTTIMSLLLLYLKTYPQYKYLLQGVALFQGLFL
jgi:hypothetical protein